VLVVILGFIPPLLAGYMSTSVMSGPFTGFLLGVFAVNWFHSLAHLIIGIGGLATYRNSVAARTYCLVIGVAYAALFVLGLIFGLSFLGGFLPLNGADNVLHLLSALLAFGAFFASRKTLSTA
jgi:Domain of unknown function (DUF4383)